MKSGNLKNKIKEELIDELKKFTEIEYIDEVPSWNTYIDAEILLPFKLYNNKNEFLFKEEFTLAGRHFRAYPNYNSELEEIIDSEKEAFLSRVSAKLEVRPVANTL